MTTTLTTNTTSRRRELAANIDLHSHSCLSDGALPPAEVVARAKRLGVHVLALTDHDEVAGLADAQAAATAEGVRFIPGVEISVTWARRGVHIVGLNIDPQDARLRAGLAQTRRGRLARAGRIAEQLERAGYPGGLEAAQRLAGNPEIISRTHFARFLVEQGAAPSVGKVFDHYLSPGKPGFEPMQWASLEDALSWIHGAGGRAVIAHPGRYTYDPTAFDAFFAAFADLGGEGIEVITGSHTPEQYREYAEVAARYGFLASRGSDFHAPGESRVDLGQLPALPPHLAPIWHDWL
ncbi:MAG: PHP domain-containing protein [Pigmentiphaga sp.]|nr:PHP domain-containing protein [Pigmentiphaga sp.]